MVGGTGGIWRSGRLGRRRTGDTLLWLLQLLCFCGLLLIFYLFNLRVSIFFFLLAFIFFTHCVRADAAAAVVVVIC